MKTPDDFTKPEQVQRKIKGGLWFTRADHIEVGSTPPIDQKFGDNMCKGDTLSDKELEDFMVREIRGVRKMMSSSEMVKNFREGTKFLNPEYLESELSYYRKRGLDVTEVEVLLEEVRHLK